jgi:hypothetical protein
MVYNKKNNKMEDQWKKKGNLDDDGGKKQTGIPK